MVLQPRQLRSQQSRPNGDAVKDCFHVRIKGTPYTSIAWYVGRRHAHPSERKAVLRDEGCWQRAVNLLHGDTKTLQSGGFARRRPQRGKELLPEGTALLKARPTDTLVSSVRAPRQGEPSCMKVQLVNGVGGCRCKLFRLVDLQRVLS